MESLDGRLALCAALRPFAGGAGRCGESRTPNVPPVDAGGGNGVGWEEWELVGEVSSGEEVKEVGECIGGDRTEGPDGEREGRLSAARGTFLNHREETSSAKK